eukprot:gene2953-1935_t
MLIYEVPDWCFAVDTLVVAYDLRFAGYVRVNQACNVVILNDDRVLVSAVDINSVVKCWFTGKILLSDFVLRIFTMIVYIVIALITRLRIRYYYDMCFYLICVMLNFTFL